MTKASRIVDQMMENDAFSRWLGVERIRDDDGVSELRMTVRGEMLNGFGITHGGVLFSFADSALAFASNSHGQMAVSVETSISHLKPVYEGDVLTAIATETHRSARLAYYQVTVTNQNSESVALFKGLVYRKKDQWDIPE